MAATTLEKTQKSNALDRTLAKITKLGLSGNLIELETRGYTTLHGVLDAGQLDRARAAILRRAERAAGKAIDVAQETAEGFRGMQYIPYLLYEDAVFEDILVQERPLALITYLLGESCLLSSMGCHFRGPGGAPLMLHSDNGNGIPAPFSPISIVANVNYALTPYGREAGALAMVPGSHRLMRQPTAAENFAAPGRELGEALAAGRAGGPQADLEWSDPPGAVAMDLEPGDAVVWHGNTWHGSFQRRLPGVRMNLAVYFNRQYVQTQERHGGPQTEALLQRHADDERLAVLLGGKQPYGWREEGPDYSVMARNPRGLFD